MPWLLAWMGQWHNAHSPYLHTGARSATKPSNFTGLPFHFSEDWRKLGESFLPSEEQEEVQPGTLQSPVILLHCGLRPLAPPMIRAQTCLVSSKHQKSCVVRCCQEYSKAAALHCVPGCALSPPPPPLMIGGKLIQPISPLLLKVVPTPRGDGRHFQEVIVVTRWHHSAYFRAGQLGVCPWVGQPPGSPLHERLYLLKRKLEEWGLAWRTLSCLEAWVCFPFGLCRRKNYSCH